MFWRRKKEKKTIGQGVFTDKAARLIVGIQGKFGSILNHKTRNWSRQQQFAFLILITIGMGTVTVVQLLGPKLHLPVNSQVPQPVSPHPIDRMSVPQRLSVTDSIAYVTFLERLKQLRNTPAGRDSLRKFSLKRPGFIDSVLRWHADVNK